MTFGRNIEIFMIIGAPVVHGFIDYIICIMLSHLFNFILNKLPDLSFIIWVHIFYMTFSAGV